MMKVLQVIDTLGIGGAEALLCDLAPRLRASGCDSSVFVLKRCNTALESTLEQQGTEVYFASHSSIYSPAHTVSLARHLLQHRYDLVHVHLFPAQLWVALTTLAIRRRIPLVTTEHSTYNRRRKFWFRPLDRWMYRQYASIACISGATAAELIRWLPEVAGKTHVIPNGVATERFRSANPHSKMEVIGKNDKPVILTVGRFDPPKDHATLLRAATNVPDVHVVIVGSGPTMPEMKAMAITLGIADRVHFLGRRQDVPELIKMADIYVQSSRWEGFGVAALEAMAGGLPVVASRVPGLSDVVEQAGLFFAPGNDQQLATHIQQLLRDPERRVRMAQKGLARAEKFKIEHTVNRYLALYRSVLSQS